MSCRGSAPVAACIVIRLEDFVASQRLDQRAVAGEVLVRPQCGDVFVLQQRTHEVIEQIALLQSFSMLGTRRLAKVIHQLPFAPQTVKQLLQRAQQLFYGTDVRPVVEYRKQSRSYSQHLRLAALDK